jgi:hypothetical protein
MANPKPHHYVIRVNAVQVASPTSKRTIAGTLGFDVSRCSATGKGRSYPIDSQAIVVRPGDSISFELGDVPFSTEKPELRIRWKFSRGKEWKGAPTRPGEVVTIPAGAGLAGARFTFNAKVNLKQDAMLPIQTSNRRGYTLIQLDPDVIVDEC